MQHLSIIKRYRTQILLLFMAVVCISVNLTKAFHIDDIAHVQIARAIIDNPLHPMSGLANWVDSAEPIHQLNQPHLFFYLMAPLMAVFGESAFVLHILMALMSIMTLMAFYVLARELVPGIALQATALFVLGPCFLPGQNVMVDVPLVGLWILFIFTVIKAGRHRPARWYILAAVLAAAACLVKYSSLVLLPILLVMVIFRKHGGHAWVLLIPMAALGGWSLFNTLDYGGIHLLGRPVGDRDAARVLGSAVDWVAGLGATAVFGLILLSPGNRKRFGRWLFLFSGLAGVGVLVSILLHYPETRRLTAVLWALFYANGVLVCFAALFVFIRAIRRGELKRDDPGGDHVLVLMLWWGGAFAFTVLFAPFMAVRHILLAVPAILLLILDKKKNGGRWLTVAVVGTAVMGILLALSDYHLAGVYREHARTIRKKLPEEARVVSLGHWGWQWYSESQGMVIYDAKRTVLEPGDYLVMPRGVDQQGLSEQHVALLKPHERVVVESGPATLFRTMSGDPPGGYYSFSFNSQVPPWFLSRAPLEEFYIFRVVGPAPEPAKP